MGYLAPVVDPVIAKAEELKAMAIDYALGLVQSAKTALCLGGGGEEEEGGSKLEVAQGILDENLDMERIDECLPGEVDPVVVAGAQAEEPCVKQTWLATLREVFDAIDEDGDGSLQRSEVQNALKRGIIKNTLVRSDILMSKAMFQKFFNSMVRLHICLCVYVYIHVDVCACQRVMLLFT